MTAVVRSIDELLKICNVDTQGPWRKLDCYLGVIDFAGTRALCAENVLVEIRDALADIETLREMCPGADGIQKQVRLADDIEAGRQSITDPALASSPILTQAAKSEGGSCEPRC